MKELNDIYKKYGNDILNDLIKLLIQNKKKSTGNLIKSLKVDLKNVSELIISGEDYFEFVDKGRKKGSYVPIKELESWTKLKGIPSSAAYAINNKIFKFGIKPTNVLAKTLKDLDKKIPKLENDLAKLYENKLAEDLNKKFN